MIQGGDFTNNNVRILLSLTLTFALLIGDVGAGLWW